MNTSNDLNDILYKTYIKKIGNFHNLNRIQRCAFTMKYILSVSYSELYQGRVFTAIACNCSPTVRLSVPKDGTNIVPFIVTL